MFLPSVNKGGMEKNFFSTAKNLKKKGINLSAISCSKNKFIKKFNISNNSGVLEFDRLNLNLKFLISFIVLIIKNFKKKYPNILLSVDTRKSELMNKAVKCKVDIINDVSGFKYDIKSLNEIQNKKVWKVVHHMQGTPNTMQINPKYKHVLLDIYDFFEEKINFCIKKNYNKNSIIVDPGIGFGKNINHNLRIMSKISTFHSLGCPILIGTSRKRFIEHIVTKFDTQDRTGGTLASVLYGLSQGVQLFRIHNVKEIYQGMLVFNKILNTN